MKDAQVKIILAVIIAILLVVNFMSLGKVGQLKKETSKLSQVIDQKDAEIKTLVDQAQAQQNELEGVKKELYSTNAKLLDAQKKLSSVKQEIDKVSEKIEAPKTKPTATKK